MVLSHINNQLGDSESRAGAAWYRKDRMFVSQSGSLMCSAVVVPLRLLHEQLRKQAVRVASLSPV